METQIYSEFIKTTDFFLWMSVTASLVTVTGPFPVTLWTLSERKVLSLNSLFKKDPLQMHPPLPLLGISAQELHSQLTMKSHYCKTHSANMSREAFSTGNGFPFSWTKS